jgi:hypothetical protein
LEYWGLNVKTMQIRPVELADHEAIWSIFQEVIQAGDSFVFEPDTPKEDFYKHWLASYMHTYVCEIDGLVAGAYFMKPNQPGLGNHICNAGYMVHPQFRVSDLRKRCARTHCWKPNALVTSVCSTILW